MSVPVAEMSLPQLMKACDGYFLVPVPGSEGEWQPRKIERETYVEASNRLAEQLAPEIVPWARNLLRHSDVDARERGAALLARAAEEALLGDVRAEVVVELEELVRRPAQAGGPEAGAKKAAIFALTRLRAIRSLVTLAAVPSVKKEELAPSIKEGLEKLAGRAFATSASALTWGRAQVAAEDTSHKAWTIAVAAREKSGFRPYATTGRFGTGDLVNHPKFGNGIVTKVLESSKVEILFAEGSRVLLHTDQ